MTRQATARRAGMQSHRLVVAVCIAVAAVLCGSASAQPPGSQPDRIAGKPNLNGIWQALNTANWNLEGHSAEALEEFWQLGAIGAIPAGQSVVVGGEIPYRPEALAKRARNRAEWPAGDPEAKCYMPGIPRATYMPYAFQIVQGNANILFTYEFASANRVVRMSNHEQPPIDSWMGWSNGRWEGDTLVIEVTGMNDDTWLDRAGNHHSAALKVTERYTKIADGLIQYEATLEDPEVYSRPWQIRMPLYRHAEPDARLLEFKCVPFAEQLLYGR
ncbi:MAG: hypothetical protein PVG24_13710 [Gammaproteobacteria bacterium]